MRNRFTYRVKVLARGPNGIERVQIELLESTQPQATGAFSNIRGKQARGGWGQALERGWVALNEPFVLQLLPRVCIADEAGESLDDESPSLLGPSALPRTVARRIVSLLELEPKSPGQGLDVSALVVTPGTEGPEVVFSSQIERTVESATVIGGQHGEPNQVWPTHDLEIYRVAMTVDKACRLRGLEWSTQTDANLEAPTTRSGIRYSRTTTWRISPD